MADTASLAGKPVIGLGMLVLLLPAVAPTPSLLVQPWCLRLALLMVMVPLLMGWLTFRQGTLVTVPRNPLVAAFSLILILACGTAIFATNQYDAWYGAAKWAVLLLLVVVTHNSIHDAKDKRLIMNFIALGGAFMALVGVCQYLFGLEFYLTPTHAYPWPSGTSSHKNQASSFVVMTLPIAVYLAFRATNAKRFLFWNLMVALMAAFLVYGRARQAQVALLVELLFFLMIFRAFFKGKVKLQTELKVHLRVPMLISLGIFIMLILMPPVDESFGLQNSAVVRLLDRDDIYGQKGLSLETASSHRVSTWTNTIAMIPDSLMGNGYLNWQVDYPKYAANPMAAYNLSRGFYWRYTHNDYLQTLVEFGVLSIAAGILLLYGLVAVFRSVLAAGDGDELSIYCALLTGLVGLAVVMLFSFPLSMTLQPAYLCIYVGAFSAAYATPNHKKWHLQGSFFTVICLLLALLGGWVGYRASLAWHHAQSGEAVHRHIEKDLYDMEKYPDVTELRDTIYYRVMASEMADPFHTRLDMMRGGLLAYLVITEKNSQRQAYFADRALEFLAKVRRAFPYYAYPYITEAQIWESMQKPQLRKKALEKVVELAPGDVGSVKAIALINLQEKSPVKAFLLLDDFFRRFYDGQLLDVYLYSAQEANRQNVAIGTLSKIDLTKRGYIYKGEVLHIENDKINRVVKILASQVRSQD